MVSNIFIPIFKFNNSFIIIVEYKVNFIAPHPQLAIADGASIRIIDNNDTTVYIDKIIDSVCLIIILKKFILIIE